MTSIGSPSLKCLGLVALGAFSPLLLADEAKAWEFQVTPYFFAAAIDAKATVGDYTTDIDLSANEVLKHTESGFMGMFEARHNRLILAFDATYFKLSEDEAKSFSGPFGRVPATGEVNIDTKQWIYQPMIGYVLMDDKIEVDAYLGARYTKINSDTTLSVTTTLPAFPGGGRSLDGDLTWTDAVIGSHVRWPINEKFFASGLADVGGFGIGASSKLTYQALAAAGWQFTPTLSAMAGYRVMYQDYEKDQFEWEVTYSGVIVGMGIKF